MLYNFRGIAKVLYKYSMKRPRFASSFKMQVLVALINIVDTKQSLNTFFAAQDGPRNGSGHNTL